jgi:hypothetical protein
MTNESEKKRTIIIRLTLTTSARTRRNGVRRGVGAERESPRFVLAFFPLRLRPAKNSPLYPSFFQAPNVKPTCPGHHQGHPRPRPCLLPRSFFINPATQHASRCFLFRLPSIPGHALIHSFSLPLSGLTKSRALSAGGGADGLKERRTEEGGADEEEAGGKAKSAARILAFLGILSSWCAATAKRAGGRERVRDETEASTLLPLLCCLPCSLLCPGLFKRAAVTARGISLGTSVSLLGPASEEARERGRRPSELVLLAWTLRWRP